ncbi:hypothetical protein chiPu_0012198 [Chiloscyllium punctatum]|uniref:Uncharacterized protein n=1 Tax=Chiloscyllium punctatum TaxID=137246 RepID=A0A401STM6_CHIPU|nr:hypothetical protein [Chiloscyllium punctatum]
MHVTERADKINQMEHGRYVKLRTTIIIQSFLMNNQAQCESIGTVNFMCPSREGPYPFGLGSENIRRSMIDDRAVRIGETESMIERHSSTLTLSLLCMGNIISMFEFLQAPSKLLREDTFANPMTTSEKQ